MRIVGSLERVWWRIAGSSCSSSSRFDSSSFFVRMIYRSERQCMARRECVERQTAVARYDTMAGFVVRRKSNNLAMVDNEVRSWLINVKTHESEK